MSVDLPQKIAHLCRDFRATLAFVEFIPYELEKRIVARLGLVKIEALASIAGTFKNELKRVYRATKPTEIAHLETLLTQLRRDVGKGIRECRNAQAGHSLALQIKAIPDQWLFMGHSSYSILVDDLNKIEAAIAAIEPAYTPLQLPPLPDAGILADWAATDGLDNPADIRFAQVYAGPWTPDVASVFPGGHPMQDASLRVMGLSVMIRQMGLLLRPFFHRGEEYGPWAQLLTELGLIDLFSLEEAVFDGNVQGATPSLIDEWAAIRHPGVPALAASRALLPAARLGWRDNIRNKVCAHMDLYVRGAMLDMRNWPLDLGKFDLAINALCNSIRTAARADIRTRYIGIPVTKLNNVVALAGPQSPKWADT